jgi:hypothetical protein
MKAKTLALSQRGSIHWFLVGSLILMMSMTPPLMGKEMKDSGHEYWDLSQQLSWRSVTDGVMGGVSQGSMTKTERQGQSCLRLAGRVSTANNGGFIQINARLPERIRDKVSDYEGVVIRVMGNEEAYQVHLKSDNLWLPWQSYRSRFQATSDWQEIRMPFSAFEPYKTRSSLKPQRINRIGIVAIGRDFDADFCVSGVGLYKRI